MRDAIAVALCEPMKALRPLSASVVSDQLKNALKQPILAISHVVGVEKAIKDLLQRSSRLQKEDVAALVGRNLDLLGPLSLARRSQCERMRAQWDQSGAVSNLQAALYQLSTLLTTPTFDDDAREIQSKILEAEESHRRTEERLTVELPRAACLQMSTIGSSHKLLGSVKKEEDGPLMDFDRLTLDASSDEKAIIIFDEAGCAPSCELLGLTRLESSIEALVLVGDKEQLPLRQSSATLSSSRRQTQGRRLANRGRDFARPKQAQVKSLLDCSRLSLDLSKKVKLTTQRRAPRDIAAILNDRVHNGDYKAAPGCAAPARGLQLVGAALGPEPRRKCVNKYEVDEVLTS